MTEVRVNFEGGSVPGKFYDLVYENGMRIVKSWVFSWGDDTAVIVDTRGVVNAKEILRLCESGRVLG